MVVFLAFVLIVFGVFGFALAPMITQTQKLFSQFPSLVASLAKYPIFASVGKGIESDIVNQLQMSSKSIVNVTLGAFSSVISLISILVFTIYLLIDFPNVRGFLLALLPKKNRTDAAKLLAKVEGRLGSWIRGELVLMTVIGVLTFIGLNIIGLEFALSLALIAGLLEIIPTLGPTIAAIPAAIIGFAISPTKGIAVIILYIIVQQLENTMIVPKIMKKAVGLNPLITLLAVLIGGKLFSFAGMLFAVPVVLVGQTIIEYLVDYKEQ